MRLFASAPDFPRSSGWLLLVITLVVFTPLRAADTSPTDAQLADTPIDFNDYRGKVVVVDFWASWCVPCRRSFPWLNEMHEKYADSGLVIIGVNLDNEVGSAAEFLAEFPAEFQIAYDVDKTLARQFSVQAMPSSFVIGRDGSVRNRHLGFKVRQQDDYEAAIVAALRQQE